MVTVLLATALFFGIPFCVMAYLVCAAPEGYEDENGFHYGRQYNDNTR